jgi:predicted nucleic-acid-binding protein
VKNAVDTNVLARALANDGSEQVAVARSTVSRSAVYVPITVLLETEWILRKSIGLTGNLINKLFSGLAGMKNVEIEDRQAVLRSIALHKSGMDFADALHLSRSAECDAFLTYDRKFIRQAAALGVEPAVRLP